MNEATTPPAGPRALANRRRILEQAGVELLRNPGASMEDIAAAAGIVRRTLYGHFPTREALVEGILDQAFVQIESALTEVDLTRPPAVASAATTIRLWAVGDEFCLLFRLMGDDIRPRVIERLAPVREVAEKLIEAGKRQGVFSDHLPTPILARVLPEMVIAMLQAHADGDWPDEHAAEAAARACLIAQGMPPADAADAAREAADSLRPAALSS
ncbi:TetR/AcrR family transcriptional regulator [Nocardia thailandica]|uniref:TetR/AcrR family transcriptional regulator n=1 Tax=Nocardia thailandica TaxID=257275 RepID=UPI00030DC6E9|nr:TetR/AcrR family transcriptional regulator [Nocardia thailandica]